ncbi:TnpV protein [uncultured Oscillibacter sp.]|nr:TnpV protein [uncultured Oscillibacter sp.]
MKARDQMGWVQAVNSFTEQAEEMVLAEIVYK